MMKKYSWKSLLSLLLVLILILIILSAFITGPISADTKLMFAGSIICGLATLAAIVISYRQNQKMHDEMRRDAAEERRKAMMPFLTLQVEPINMRERFGVLTIQPDTVEGIFKEAFGVDVCLRIDAGDGTRPLKPLFEVKYLKECLNQLTQKNPAYYHRLITIKNIGEGTAHNISVTVQNEPFHNGLSLAKNETLRCLGDIHMTHSGDTRTNYRINFVMEFSDISGRIYLQEMSCEVNMNLYAKLNPPKIGVPQLREDD